MISNTKTIKNIAKLILISSIFSLMFYVFMFLMNMTVWSMGGSPFSIIKLAGSYLSIYLFFTLIMAILQLYGSILLLKLKRKAVVIINISIGISIFLTIINAIINNASLRLDYTSIVIWGIYIYIMIFLNKKETKELLS